MIRPTLVKVATPALIIALMTLAAPGVAWAAPVATGTATCPIISGSGTLHPGLTAAGSPGGVKITFKATLGPVPVAGCSSTAVLATGLPVSITGGTLKGSGSFNGPPGILPISGNSCASFDGPDILSTIKAKVHWNAAPAIAPSKVTYTGGTPAVSGAPTDTISLPAPGTSTVKAGSLATPPLPDSIKLVTNIPSVCAPTAPPVKTFTITGGSVSL
jgi:hypothetical protein